MGLERSHVNVDGELEIEGATDFVIVGELDIVGETEGVADLVGKIDGMFIGEVEGVADLVGEFEIVGDSVG